MKYIYIIFVLFLPISLFSQSSDSLKEVIVKDNLYKQTIIQLNTEKGIPVDPVFPNLPLDKIKSSSSIDGFDVDKSGNIFFLSGNHHTLTVFKNEKKMLSKNYNELFFSKIHIYENQIYAYCNKYNKSTSLPENSLYVLNKLNGNIENTYKHLITNTTQQPHYLDSFFVIEVHEENKTLPKTTFFLYDLKGTFIQEINNPLNLSVKEYKLIYEMKNKLIGAMDFKFLGFWKSYRIYMHKDYSEKLIRPTQFTLTDNLGNIIKTFGMDSEVLGDYFYGPENDFEIIRNGSIFVLRRDKEVKNAILTEIPLEKIF